MLNINERMKELNTILDNSYINHSIHKTRYRVLPYRIYDYYNMMETEEVCILYEQRGFLWKDSQKLLFLESLRLGEPIGTLYSWECGNNYPMSHMRTFSTDRIPKERPKQLNFDGCQRGSTINSFFGKNSRGKTRDRIDINVRTRKMFIVKHGHRTPKSQKPFVFEDIGLYMEMDSGAFNCEVKKFLIDLCNTVGYLQITKDELTSYREYIWSVYWIRQAEIYNIILDSSWQRSEVGRKFQEINDNLTKVDTQTKVRNMLINTADGVEQKIDSFVFKMGSKINNMLDMDQDLLRSAFQRVYLYIIGHGNAYKTTLPANAKLFKDILNDGTNSILFNNLVSETLNEELINLFIDTMNTLGCTTKNKRFSISIKLKEGIFSLIVLGISAFAIENEKIKRELVRALASFAYAANISIVVNGGDVDLMARFWSKLYNEHRHSSVAEDFIKSIRKEAERMFKNVDIETGLLINENNNRFYRALLFAWVRNNTNVFLGKDSLSTYVKDNLNSNKTRIDVDHLFPEVKLKQECVEEYSCVANFAPMNPFVNRSKQAKLPSVYYSQAVGDIKNVFGSSTIKKVFNEEEEAKMLSDYGLWPGWDKIQLKDVIEDFFKVRAPRLANIIRECFYSF